MKEITIAALVPMRHTSERVPGKNYRVLACKPLYMHILDTLLAVPEVSTVVVDTDSPVILEGLRTGYPSVRVLNRPEHLCADTIPMNEILMYDTSEVPADLYVQTHSTNPLLRPETISGAINKYIENREKYDSLFSVTRMQTRFWNADGTALNHDPEVLLRTQDLPPVYEENSCLYIFTREILAKRRNRLGCRPMLFEIDPTEAWDIDEELDFEIVEFLLKRRTKHRS